MTHHRNSNDNTTHNYWKSLPNYPSDLLEKWFYHHEEAELVGTLSMLDRDGALKSRSLKIESIDASGNFYIAMNIDSFWMDLTESQSVSLSFNNYDTSQQANLQGTIEITRVQDSLRNYLKQNSSVKAYSLISDYPQPLVSKFEACARFAWKKQEIENQNQELNPNWTMFIIKPQKFEFIVTSKDDMPECLEYIKKDDHWCHQYQWI